MLYILCALYSRFVESRVKRAWGQIALRSVGRVGENCRVHGRIRIYFPKSLTLGDDVRIGEGCFFSCEGGLVIGSNTQCSRNVVIYTANHDVQGEWVPYGPDNIRKPVTIGRSVWIGMNVCIAPGVTIGDGAVIGMGTVVAKHVPAGAVVVGAGQRIVGQRDMERFAILEASGRLFGRLDSTGGRR